ncbi:PQQ-dependent sugar dehydrogenase [Nocardioides panacisoli]|uniref:PQQ-dependent sugar dehydrogenase n=1 Tax=Nocardioides panacisoli TaxID=627624 RepID=A0ABP7I5W5_9ACTN
MLHRALPALLVTVALTATACSQGGNESVVEITGSASAAGESATPSESSSSSPSGTGTTAAVSPTPQVVATAATGLDVPWGLDFLPDGRAIVTERDTAKVLLVSPPVDGQPGDVVEAGTVPKVVPTAEAGLLGVAVSPHFAKDRTVFFYTCTAKENQVVKATLRNDELGKVEPVLTGIPNGEIHDGGRIAFGPDGDLYVTTGETGDEKLARDRDNYAGKILRITPEGKKVAGNPFDTVVYSWGHRNMEGIAWDDSGNLWASEFGKDTADELNLIQPGLDYGWPVVEGMSHQRGYTNPQLTWPPDDASPSGLAFDGGYLWMAALQGERLYRITVQGKKATDPEGFFEGDYGRIRTVVTAPDGNLWMTTSNTDGRGDPGPDDDQILVVEP